MGAATLLALLAAATSVGLKLEETDQLAFEDATELTGALAKRVEARSGRTVVVDDPVWSSCAGDERCLDQVRARTGGGDVVLLSIFGGLSRARVVAERSRPGEASPTHVERDVPRDRKSWGPALDDLARALFPEAPEPPGPEPIVGTSLDPTPSTPKLEGTRWAPWIAVGAGVALAGAGAAFGVSSAQARADSADPNLADPAFEALADRTQAHAIAADALFGAATVAVVTGVVLLLFDP